MKARVISKAQAAGMIVAFAVSDGSNLYLKVRVPKGTLPKPLQEHFRRYGMRREGKLSQYWSAPSGKHDDQIIRAVIECGGAFAYTDPWERNPEAEGLAFAESVATMRGFARTIVNRHNGTYSLLFWRPEYGTVAS